MAHIENHKEVVGGHGSVVNVFFWLGNFMAFIWAMREDIGHAIIIVLFTTTVGWGYKKILNSIDQRITRRNEKSTE